MLKKLTKVLMIPFFLFIFVTTTNAMESIQSYDVEFTIERSSNVRVKETILYDFGTLQKHGIFRYIPITLTNNMGDVYKLDIQDIRVSDVYGDKINFSKTYFPGEVQFKIGDANKTITGVKTYIIEYTIRGGINYFEDHDELYWNAIGDGWEVPIEEASAKIYLPFGTSKDTTNIACYLDDGTCITSFDQNTDSYLFEAYSLKPGRTNLTVVLGFPKGVVDFVEPVKDHSGIWSIIIAALLIILGIFFYLVLPILILIKTHKLNKDFKSKLKIVSAWFQAPNKKSGSPFSPLETGGIYKQKIDFQCITSVIIYLAQLGYIKIVEVSKGKFKFVKIKEFDMSEYVEEGEIFKKMFASGDEVTMSELKKDTSFGKYVYELMNGYSKIFVKREDIFKSDPNTQKSLGILMISFGAMSLNVLLVIAGVLFKMRYRWSDVGIQKYSEAASLRNFLVSQDEKLDYMAEEKMFFEKLLPYATAFGVEDVWIKKFGDLVDIKPDWYESNSAFNAYALPSLSHNISRDVSRGYQSYYSSTRSSSGFSSGFSGGSSGGGGGGGGGGSW